MITVVSGMYRSGTSAMMRALAAGGLPIKFSDSRDAFADAMADVNYHPNEDGLFEVPLRDYGNLGFPTEYEGYAVKIMLWGLPSMSVNPNGYRLVVMARDPEEIRQSAEGSGLAEGRHPWLVQYGQRMEWACDMMRNRRDVTKVDVVHYREDLLANPVGVFAALDLGDDFNVAKAAATIDPTRYRFRRELLTVGL